ncbi:uncharacterized protein Z519_04243 [Cladophialophora bantiana CBS 173.52]|uniref:Xylanolytic transcriptional activator regulatory domain-containing protein n=1 Tax=Cladophialophora bantiana (strain ATCC 10958 / CBS 173.52 / CDC B-1940 / NIH 8579) TaxID=1442370 RepID=A0A0D2HQE0_CLAB1|nr:uncharacterized protein Z519_04243 [Cladophialophora bantiana CBS 173.52]KIW95658.1 hypothetical protein Z519_04243 [Cladophialophora bantiana CBS 173.52]
MSKRPGYWLSICSGPGRAWIRKRIGSDEFEEISEELQDSWAKALKLEHNEPASKCAEPEPQLAWKYCNAYFERSVDGLFGAVYRPEFERYLRAHLSGKLDYNDSAWYALRNVVYAGGCRISRSEDASANFVGVQREAWGYFQNSLSVHSELLLTRPSLRSVRAWLAMGLFADGLASPALSSGLVSNAALLAQSLGLHRKTVEIGSNRGSEALRQTWLFWGVYCSEKHIAQRCGRPSVIDDDDIDCDIPSILQAASSTEPEMLTYTIQACQIYDQISKELLATQALHEPPMKMFDLVAHFDTQLRLFKEALPQQLRPVSCLKQFHMPGTIRMLGLMTTHCSFYDLLMLVHTIFAYPWIIESFPSSLDASLAVKVKTQIAVSSQIVADVARSLIVIERNLDIDRAGTQSFMLHFPMHTFVDLFVYVNANPEMPSVKSDLAHLDVAAVYFGQMEFVTGSKLRFPLHATLQQSPERWWTKLQQRACQTVLHRALVNRNFIMLQ